MRTAGQILLIIGFAGAIFAFTWLIRSLPGAGIFGMIGAAGFILGGLLYWAGARRAKSAGK
jgi:hypothetical protein